MSSRILRAPGSFALLFGAIWFVVGGSLALGGFLAWRHEGRFAREGVLATGVVVSLEVDRAERGRGTTRYRVRYHYEVDFESHRGSDEVPVELWQGLEEQGPVPVLYLPETPGLSRVAGGRSTEEVVGLALLGGGLLFAVPGVIILGFGLRQRRTAARIERSGLPAEATIAEVGPTRARINNVVQWRVRYTYRDYAGHEHAGKSPLLPPEEAQAYTVGESVTVRYDRDRPGRSLLAR